MPVFVQPYTWKLNDVATPTLINTNPAGITAALNNIDNANIGAAGLYASNLIPTSVAQATFGGVQNYVFPRGLIVAGGVSTSAGLQTNTASGMGVYTGTGSPSFNAPTGTLYLRYDSAATATVAYINTSGASSSGTTWTPITNLSAVYSAQGSSIITYTPTNGESAGSPGTMATATLTLPGSSPGTNGNWRVFVTLIAQDSVGSFPPAVKIGIGSAAAGSSGYPLYGNGATTHSITGGNCISDVLGLGTQSIGTQVTCSYSAIYANSTALSFTALLGSATTNTHVVNGSLVIQAFPN